MKKIKCASYEDAVSRLQVEIDRFWHTERGHVVEANKKRRWLKAVPEDSYGNPKYRVELWVLEGSPAKQIVLVNHYDNAIYCLDVSFHKEFLFQWPGGEFRN